MDRIDDIHGWDGLEPQKRNLPEFEPVDIGSDLNTSAGQMILKFLARRYLQTRVGPESSNRQIWFIEGQRSVISSLFDLSRKETNNE